MATGDKVSSLIVSKITKFEHFLVLYEIKISFLLHYFYVRTHNGWNLLNFATLNI